MFSGEGTLKVTDLGIAKVIGGSSTLATRHGEILGTPAYIAPEQAQGYELTPATDVYAAGTLLYELLAGRLPFPADSRPGDAPLPARARGTSAADGGRARRSRRSRRSRRPRRFESTERPLPERGGVRRRDRGVRGAHLGPRMVGAHQRAGFGQRSDPHGGAGRGSNPATSRTYRRRWKPAADERAARTRSRRLLADPVHAPGIPGGRSTGGRAAPARESGETRGGRDASPGGVGAGHERVAAPGAADDRRRRSAHASGEARSVAAPAAGCRHRARRDQRDRGRGDRTLRRRQEQGDTARVGFKAARRDDASPSRREERRPLACLAECTHRPATGCGNGVERNAVGVGRNPRSRIHRQGRGL